MDSSKDDTTSLSASTAKCEKSLENSFKNKKVTQLLDSIESLGCHIPPNFFRCRSCPNNISGGFLLESESTTSNDKNKSNCKAISTSMKPHVVICENHNLEPDTFQHTIIHELVHAYDICRVKPFDGSNVEYHACTEVRASSLSGECNILHEIFRGKYQFQGGHRDCVKRRATKSLAMNPSAGVCFIIIFSLYYINHFKITIILYRIKPLL